MGVVLGGGPHHGRSADVDELDAGVDVERVQPGDDEGDRFDAVVLQIPLMVGVVGVGEDAAVDERMKGYHSMAEDRGESGELGHLGDRNTGLPDGPRRPATREQLPSELVETLGQLGDAPFVIHGQQGGRHGPEGNEPTTKAVAGLRGRGTPWRRVDDLRR